MSYGGRDEKRAKKKRRQKLRALWLALPFCGPREFQIMYTLIDFRGPLVQRRYKKILQNNLHSLGKDSLAHALTYDVPWVNIENAMNKVCGICNRRFCGKFAGNGVYAHPGCCWGHMINIDWVREELHMSKRDKDDLYLPPMRGIWFEGYRHGETISHRAVWKDASPLVAPRNTLAYVRKYYIPFIQRIPEAAEEAREDERRRIAKWRKNREEEEARFEKRELLEDKRAWEKQRRFKKLKDAGMDPYTVNDWKMEKYIFEDHLSEDRMRPKRGFKTIKKYWAAYKLLKRMPLIFHSRIDICHILRGVDIPDNRSPNEFISNTVLTARPIHHPLGKLLFTDPGTYPILKRILEYVGPSSGIRDRGRRALQRIFPKIRLCEGKKRTKRKESHIVLGAR